MPKRTLIDWDAVATLANHKIITARELDILGVPRQTVHRRASRDGPWTRLLPGVLLLSNGTPTTRQRLESALRYAGEGAQLTGLPAADLHGLQRLPPFSAVHVLIPEARKRASTRYVVVERTSRLPAPQIRAGFPAAPLARAVLDAARRLTDIDQIRALLAEPVQRGLVDPSVLAEELDSGSGRGTARCRVVLREMLANVHSPAEGWAYRLLQQSDLPQMQWNVRILDSTGKLLGVPDGWFDDAALAWQIDSLEYHLSPADYQLTVRRHTAMTAAGIVVVHTLPSQLRTEPRKVLAGLRNAYQHALRRPRPPVTAVTKVR
ncbi:hypothetical protein AB0H34_09635 [Saccharopolyspora shandongensis]|uniref:hypothetical protein n=1 Tax=Saccharopolyspora shandongensis TaxID=418495 RepID=UPI0033E245D0